MEGGRVVKNHDNKPGVFGIPVSPLPGVKYAVTIDILNSTKGYLTLSFGNTAFDERFPGSKPGTYTRIYEAREPGGLWVNASSEFDGAVSNIHISRPADLEVKPMSVIADNGILRLEGGTGSGALTDFETNWTTSVSARVKASEPSRLVYLMWPSRYMLPYLDGKPMEWRRVSGSPGFLDIPPGDHLFELHFESGLATTFKVFLYVFALLFVLALALSIFERFLEPTHPGQMLSRLKRVWHGRVLAYRGNLPSA